MSPVLIDSHCHLADEVFAADLEDVVGRARSVGLERALVILAGGDGEVTGVLHCCTGGPSLARAGLDLGFYISLSGIVTFPKAADLRETLRAVPLDRALIETDSPFLAPAPHRGKRNEPAYVARVADALAALHGTSVDAAC